MNTSSAGYGGRSPLSEVPTKRRNEGGLFILSYTRSLMNTSSAGYGGRSPLSDHHDFHYVYILRCGDGKLYTGCTQNLNERIVRHHNGHVPATKHRQPIQLLTFFAFTDKYQAFAFEQYLKSGSGRAFLNKRLI